MDELQLLSTWNDWDDINLSTPELRRQRLEILLCQKLKNGEDISQCLQVLDYLNHQATEQKLSEIFIQRIRNKSQLEFLQQVGFISMAVLLSLTCCFATFKLANFSAPNFSRDKEKHHLIDSILRNIKRLDQLH